MVGIASKDLVEHSHGLINFSQNAEEGSLGAHDVVDDASRLISAVGEAQAIFVALQSLSEIVYLKLFCSLDSAYSTLSSFCFNTLIFKLFLNEYKLIEGTSKPKKGQNLQSPITLS